MTMNLPKEIVEAIEMDAENEKRFCMVEENCFLLVLVQVTNLATRPNLIFKNCESKNALTVGKVPALFKFFKIIGGG